MGSQRMSRNQAARATGEQSPAVHRNNRDRGEDAEGHRVCLQAGGEPAGHGVLLAVVPGE